MKKERATLMLIITNGCNLRCTYCYEDHEAREPITLEIAQKEITEVLTNIEKYESITISLFGGEPFLYFNRVKEICEWTWSKDWPVPFNFSFSTNGTLFTKEVKEWLTLYKERLFLVLSADGTKASQDLNRSNSFDSIDYSFFKRNWLYPQVKMTISQESIKNLANDVIFFHKRGFQFAECNMAMGIDWSNPQNQEILKTELSKLVKYYEIHKDIMPANIIYMNVGSCENKKVMHKWCGVGKELMTIDVDGKKYPCNFITPMSFNKEELDTLLLTDFTDIRAILDKECFESCYLYPICPTCYGADYLLSKKINVKNKTTCEVLKICAYYSALVRANRIDDIGIDKLSTEEKGKLYKTIKAIKTIVSNYKEYGVLE